METLKLVELFKSTTESDPEEAEKQLLQVHKIIGFMPTVLQIIIESRIELPIRQAAAVYFKNEVYYYWEEKEPKNNQIPYHIHEQDRDIIRNSIVDAIVMSNAELITNNLAMSLNYIIKFDFPDRWPTLVDKINQHLEISNHWLGALTALLQLGKNYEYKTNTEKEPLINALKIIAPRLYSIMVEILPDNSEQSVLIQKTILKIIYILTQFSLPLTIFNRDFFLQWMVIIRQVLDRPVPDEVNKVDVEQRYDLPWYKAKKWSLHIIVRIFDRYGLHKIGTAEYKSFGRWYIETFSHGFIQVILKMLEEYSQNIYIPQRVLQECINYLINCVERVFTWKILKPHISQIMEKVIFRLLCYTDEDDELWNDDPEEYVRKKFDFFEDYISPASSAQHFLSTCCKKRKEMLKNTIEFAIHVLTAPHSLPQYKDGALHMLGCASEIMAKKKAFNKEINDLLNYHVFPYINNEKPFLRARAAWIIHFFDSFDFENEMTLMQAVNCLQNLLINDKELPVKVQAAISLLALITKQEKSKPFVEANLEQIILKSLEVIEASQNDDVSNGLQRLICAYSEKLAPIAARIVESLSYILEKVLEKNSDENDTTITLMGLLNAIDTILMLNSENEEYNRIEQFAKRSVEIVLNNNLSELYEECFNIVTSLTDKKISNEMWNFFGYIYQITTKDIGMDYFADLLPALHNFLTVDPDAFISDESRVKIFFEICKYVLSAECLEDTYCNAVKMIEVFFLQFREKISNVIPSFCEIVLDRYISGTSTESSTKELRNLCLQTFLVVLYIDSDLFFQIMKTLEQKYAGSNLLNSLFEEWLTNINYFMGLHDRKVCIMAICKLLTLPANQIPPIVHTLAPKIMPELMILFENLKESYKVKANADADSSDDGSDYIYSDEEEHSGSEMNNIDDMEKNYIDEDDYPSSDDYSDDENDLTALENFETTIDKENSIDDEYILFRTAVEYLKQQNVNLYNLLFSNLNAKQLSTLEDVFGLAQLRQNAAESRKIEQSGGYSFANQTIPTTFNFGGNFPQN